MRILVDTNVIADVLYDDPLWAEWAKLQLTQNEGQTFINPIIYTELCYRARTASEVDQIIAGFAFDYEELPRTALFLAAQAYRLYRERGGVKTAPLPDFFIGAHAQAVRVPLLTRDKERYQTYFPGISLISP